MKSSSHLPRKQPTQARARATGEAILQAAAEVFEAFGYDDGTTERVAARAGVSIGSFYQYFPNKDALLVALAARHRAETLALQQAWLDGLARDDPSLDDGLRGYVDWLVASHAARPRLACLMFEDRPVPAEVAQEIACAHAATVEGLSAWLTGRVRRPRVTAWMLHRTVPHLVHSFVLHPREGLPTDVAAEEITTLARAYLSAVAVEQDSARQG